MNTAKRFLFRVLFVYVLLYCFPFPVNVIPIVGEMVEQPYTDLWNEAVPWVGERLFRVEVRFRPAGSGDTTYNYVQLYCFLVLALAAAAVWMAVSFFRGNRERQSDARLHEWLRVYVRFVLATAMIFYGASKVVPAQMAAPWPGKLLQPIGDASPMGLVWTFMGASFAYMAFTGAGEMLGGLLLAFRRTTLLGALVCIGVMSNVVMINFSYDVPVKLYSSHLLLMAVFLAVPDLKRLANLLVLNRPVPPSDRGPLFAERKPHWAALALRMAFVLFITWTSLHGAWQAYREFEGAPRPRLYGVWEVEALAIDGVDRPLLITDAEVWRRLTFEWPGAIGIQRAQDTRVRYYELKREPGARGFVLTKYDDPAWKARVSYRLAGADVLALEGEIDGKKVRARFRRRDESSYRLVSRGFRWINEWPYNR